MKCGSAALPAGSSAALQLADSAAVGHVLKQLLARTEVTESRGLVAVSDAVASFRVLYAPAGCSDGDVNTLVAKELPLEAERIASRWVEVRSSNTARVVYAVAWDRGRVKSVIDALKAAGVEAAVVELRSAALARTVTARQCVIVDLGTDRAEIVLVDEHVPHVWHGLELKGASTEELAPAIGNAVRSVINFFRRSRRSEIESSSPILVACENVLPSQLQADIAELTRQPVQMLPPPQRVPPNVRHSTYLACLGLIMRRGR